MTEQNSKGIALVILGIVAIIAIVGLVLLFTGAKKSTGEFAVPIAKEYGGAIKGITDPYARAFPGRSYEMASGIEGREGIFTQVDYPSYAGMSVGKVASQKAYNDYGGEKVVDSAISYNQARAQVPSVQTACEGLRASLLAAVKEKGKSEGVTDGLKLPLDKPWVGESTKSMGAKMCQNVAELKWVKYEAPYYGLDSTQAVANKGTGDFVCCVFDEAGSANYGGGGPAYSQI